MNCNLRPSNAVIDLLVIHGISLPPGQFGGTAIDDLFCNRLDCTSHPSFSELADTRVSAHLLIRRDGSITQFVPFLLRAWHAGKSRFAGRDNCNDFSVGIELEGTDHIPYEQTQYQALIRVTRELMARYPAITLDRIVGHCDIAPGRKTDPGERFDWCYYKGQVTLS